MEPAAKRQRISGNFASRERNDRYINEDLEEIYEDENDDPDLNFQESRARVDQKLKSAYESIFEKYGRDFDGIGDEIDLTTGKIVRANGHLTRMRGETDVGDLDGAELTEDEEDNGSYLSSEEDEDEDEVSTEAAEEVEGLDSDQRSVDTETEESSLADDEDNNGLGAGSFIEDDMILRGFAQAFVPKMMSNVLQSGSLNHHPQPFLDSPSIPNEIDDSNIEPAWRAPSLPGSKSQDTTSKASHIEPIWRSPYIPLQPQNLTPGPRSVARIAQIERSPSPLQSVWAESITPRRHRHPFTKEEDELIPKYIARAQKADPNMMLNAIFKQLAEEHPRHDFMTWKNRYRLKYLSPLSKSSPRASHATPLRLNKSHKILSSGIKRTPKHTPHRLTEHRIQSDGEDELAGGEFTPRGAIVPLEKKPCPHKDCIALASTLYRVKRNLHEDLSPLSLHLLDAHDTTLFPCEIPTCDRKGAQGFSLQIDLLRHMRLVHPSFVTVAGQDESSGVEMLAPISVSVATDQPSGEIQRSTMPAEPILLQSTHEIKINPLVNIAEESRTQVVSHQSTPPTELQKSMSAAQASPLAFTVETAYSGSPTKYHGSERTTSDDVASKRYTKLCSSPSPISPQRQHESNAASPIGDLTDDAKFAANALPSSPDLKVEVVMCERTDDSAPTIIAAPPKSPGPKPVKSLLEEDQLVQEAFCQTSSEIDSVLNSRDIKNSDIKNSDIEEVLNINNTEQHVDVLCSEEPAVVDKQNREKGFQTGNMGQESSVAPITAGRSRVRPSRRSLRTRQSIPLNRASRHRDKQYVRPSLDIDKQEVDCGIATCDEMPARPVVGEEHIEAISSQQRKRLQDMAKILESAVNTPEKEHETSHAEQPHIQEAVLEFRSHGIVETATKPSEEECAMPNPQAEFTNRPEEVMLEPEVLDIFQQQDGENPLLTEQSGQVSPGFAIASVFIESSIEINAEPPPQQIKLGENSNMPINKSASIPSPKLDSTVTDSTTDPFTAQRSLSEDIDELSYDHNGFTYLCSRPRVESQTKPLEDHVKDEREHSNKSTVPTRSSVLKRNFALSRDNDDTDELAMDEPMTLSSNKEQNLNTASTSTPPKDPTVCVTVDPVNTVRRNTGVAFSNTASLQRTKEGKSHASPKVSATHTLKSSTSGSKLSSRRSIASSMSLGLTTPSKKAARSSKRTSLNLSNSTTTPTTPASQSTKSARFSDRTELRRLIQTASSKVLSSPSMKVAKSVNRSSLRQSFQSLNSETLSSPSKSVNRSSSRRSFQSSNPETHSSPGKSANKAKPRSSILNYVKNSDSEDDEDDEKPIVSEVNVAFQSSRSLPDHRSLDVPRIKDEDDDSNVAPTLSPVKTAIFGFDLGGHRRR